MGIVVTGFATSLDGNPGPLFDWYSGGDTEVRYPGGMTVKVSAASAPVLRRRHFDEANGWGGRHPIDLPVFVVSHRPAPDWLAAESPFTFVADGIARAIAQAQAVAGERTSVSAARTSRSRRSRPG